MAGVSLDAMIPREDFEVSGNSTQNTGTTATSIRLADLDKCSLVFHALRKPDFQRETNEWDSEKICRLIESYVNVDLIPAVIFWNASDSHTFVIDGAHRLSALASWVNNDYGDGEVSKQFYGKIEDEQLSIAEKTRTLIRKRIGPYSDYLLAVTNPDKVSEKIVDKSKKIGLLSLQIQWVHGDQKNAETSFFKINQQGQRLTKTEITLLENRRKPNVIAARAIIKSGTGHPYWGNFEQDKQSEIKQIAVDLFHILFRPPLKKPIKSLDTLPLGGKIGLGITLPLIWNFVNLVNNLDSKDVPDDKTGDATIKYLKNCKMLAERIGSNHPSSLGLHPAIYFYSYDGRHKQASFYAGVNFVKSLETKDTIHEFLRVRENFETLLQEYNYHIQQIVRRYRGAEPAYPFITNYYNLLIKKLTEKKGLDIVIDEIMQEKDFDFLTIRQKEEHGENNGFSQNKKSSIFIKQALESAIKCNICKGFIHTNSLSFDHIMRKEDGGLNTTNNGQVTHPYCNTSFKN